MYKIFTNIKAVLFLCLLVSGILVTACSEDDEPSSMVMVNSYGPSPALRGGELKFIGTNLDKVSSIMLPGGIEVTEFKTKTPELIVIDVPEQTVDGLVSVVASTGTIEMKSMLVISEPIAITSITPAEVRPGDVVTIKGTYLNLIEEVMFRNNQSVTDFQSQSQTTIELVVPDTAQTGLVVISNGEEDPILVESEAELGVTLPAITSMSPNPVKAGEELTLSGTDLDLTTAVSFVGGARVVFDDLEFTEDGKVILTVPDNAQEGKVSTIAASLVEKESTEALTLVSPEIAAITPNPAKNSGNITVTGTNLDLITSVSFSGQTEGEGDEATVAQTNGEILDGGTATSITVKIPADATEGVVNFHTASEKSVASADVLALVKPTITSFTPTSVNTVDEPSITITGTNLDLVTDVVFEGDFTAAVAAATETSITIDVPPGSLSGKITLITTNKTEVESAASLTIVPDVPNVTGAPAEIYIGEYLTLTGTNMNVFADIYFPGDVLATQFGTKNATTIEVKIPMTVPEGKGVVTFVTNKNEIYETPVIDFLLPGAEPVVDPALVIKSFDEVLTSGDNWAGLYEEANDPAISFSGKYLHGTGTANAWTWIWGCNHDDLVKPGGITKADHVFKIDVYLTVAPPADANFEMSFNGTRIPLGNFGAATTPSWVTLTWDLSEFDALPDVINPDNVNTNEWGLNLGAGTVDLTGVYMDNFRFQEK